MIVLKDDNHITIIYQRAHALLSSKFLYHLKDEHKNSIHNYFETVLATSAHDDGYTHESGTYYLTNNGTPKDFRKRKFEREASQNILENAKLKSIWCYLLALSHMENLHAHKKANLIKSFVQDIRKTKQKILKQEKISLEALDYSYRFMQWSDQLSLELCFHLNKVSYEAKIPGFLKNNPCKIKIKNKKIHLQPYPFHESPLTLQIEYRQIPNKCYYSNRDLYEELNKGPVSYKSIEFGK